MVPVVLACTPLRHMHRNSPICCVLLALISSPWMKVNRCTTWPFLTIIKTQQYEGTESKQIATLAYPGSNMKHVADAKAVTNGNLQTALMHLFANITRHSCVLCGSKLNYVLVYLIIEWGMADIGGGREGGVQRKAKMIPWVNSLPKNNKSMMLAESVVFPVHLCQVKEYLWGLCM